MQAVPEEVIQADLKGFPVHDPAKQAALERSAKKMAKEREEQQRREERERKRMQKDMKEVQAMPVAKPKPTDSPTAALRRRELKAHKIRLYFANLGHKIHVKEPKTLPKSEEELDELLMAIQLELQSSGGIEQADQLMMQGCFAVEKLTEHFNPLGLMLSGPAASLTQTVQANKDKWQDVMVEFAVENAEWFMMGPGKRLLGIVVMTVMAVDGANKSAIAARSREPAPEEAKEKAEDL